MWKVIVSIVIGVIVGAIVHLIAITTFDRLAAFPAVGATQTTGRPPRKKYGK